MGRLAAVVLNEKVLGEPEELVATGELTVVEDLEAESQE